MKIKVAAIQMQAYDVTQAHAAMEKSLAMIDQAMDQAAGGAPDLVVLPECAYPGYFLGLTGNANEALGGLETAIRAYCDKAAKRRVFLIVGAPKIEQGKIFNAAYLIGPDGKLIGAAGKSFLWHFDARWFSAAGSYEVFATPIGRIGMIVCADGRQPEIARILSLQGAQLIVDPTNWVASGSDKQSLTSPQYEYMLPCRAAENKVWFIAANKIGTEAESIVYCGRSCIVAPDGRIVAAANSFEESIISAEIDLAESSNKAFDPAFNLFSGRNPAVYPAIAQPAEELPITGILKEAVVPEQFSVYASVVQLPDAITFERYLSLAEKMVAILAQQGSKIVVFPELPCLYGEGLAPAIISHAVELAERFGLFLVTSATVEKPDGRYKAAILAEPGGNIHVYNKTHLDAEEKAMYLAGQDLPVFRTSIGNIGLMLGYEGFIPEVARVLMLKGADLICWQTRLSTERHWAFARTRAAENRVHVAVCNSWTSGNGGKSLIVNPSGAVAAAAFASGDQAVSALLDLSSSRQKTVVPGTNVVRDRRPDSYRRLLET